jgi:hypothetical protein
MGARAALGRRIELDTKLRWSFHQGLDLGFPIGEAGRSSVEVVAAVPRIAVPS